MSSKMNDVLGTSSFVLDSGERRNEQLRGSLAVFSSSSFTYYLLCIFSKFFSIEEIAVFN